MAVPAPHFDAQSTADREPGGLLEELERRQDDVLSQLDDLDAKLDEVLKGLEPQKVEGDADAELADHVEDNTPINFARVAALLQEASDPDLDDQQTALCDTESAAETRDNVEDWA
ncbi:hypothetical protein NHH03_24230 [Stieleria sp. TO1_6]|uniref:hypothetical protein n=1 Tax=Stieleria tagensis TaxID=2956795 RepID=UPI00209A92FA|nr:hypothetical protein [Stieleria tagensis]MCO8124868.1 hypothetical protein [Stieleria tagensis]